MHGDAIFMCVLGVVRCIILFIYVWGLVRAVLLIYVLLYLFIYLNSMEIPDTFLHTYRSDNVDQLLTRGLCLFALDV